MKLKAKISSVFNTPAHRAWSAVKESRTLIFVTKGVLGFEGRVGVEERKGIGSRCNFPKTWVEGRIESTKLRFFGVIPGWQHQLYFKEICDETFQQTSEERGGLIQQWNHVIKVDSLDAESCRYSFEIEIDAGLLTPMVWFYAHLFYRYRQWRWKKMIKLNYQLD